MKVDFWKYQGTGNDFIMLDGRRESYENLQQPEIERLCHRRFGIGADGLIILRKSDEADFEMEYYNSDGRTSSMCGNGGRCIIKFARDLGIDKESYQFTAIDGLHSGRIDGNRVWLKMNRVNEIRKISDNEFYLDTGSPHHIVFEEELPGDSFKNKAQAIRFSETYRKGGVNVNYASTENDLLKLRTYERGVEDETLSCGTGVTAAALTAHFAGRLTAESIPVKAVGGDLEVRFSADGNSYDDIWLIGPAEKVFEGSIEL